MTLVESAAVVAGPSTAAGPSGPVVIRQSSSPTAPMMRRSPSPSPSPSRRRAGKENDNRADTHQQQYQQPPRGSSSPSCSPSRKRRLDGTLVASSADRGEGEEEEEPTKEEGGLTAAAMPTAETDGAAAPAGVALLPSCASDPPHPTAAPDAGANTDPGGLGSSQQRRPRRNSMSHHHDHNRSASPSPTRQEGQHHLPPQPEEEHEQAHEEEEEGCQNQKGCGGGGLDRSLSRSRSALLEDSRVGPEEGEDGENWDVPCGFNEAALRTLRIEYWDRTRECKERKWDHMDEIDARYPSREAWIWQSVLHEAEVVMEPNMFPYNTPRGIEHWTLWARRELTLAEVEAWVLAWIARERPEVTRWNLDENAQRSIDIYHVHIYLQVVPDDQVGPNPPREPRTRDRDHDHDHDHQQEGEGQEEDAERGEQEGSHEQEDGPAAKRLCQRVAGVVVDDDDKQEKGQGEHGPAGSGNGNGSGNPSARIGSTTTGDADDNDKAHEQRKHHQQEQQGQGQGQEEEAAQPQSAPASPSA